MSDPERGSLSIVVCTPRYAPQVGGAETWLRGVVSGLTGLRHRLLILGAAAGDAPLEWIDGVEVRRAASGRLAFARHVTAGIRAIRPDVVVSQYSATPFAVRAAHRAGAPAVAIVHDVYGLPESVRMKGAAPGTLRWLGLERTMRLVRPDAFLANSTSTARLLEPLAGGRSITIVPPGADHLPPTAERDDEERSGIVFVGRLVRRKGVADLIEAVRTLRVRGVDAKATVVGDGPEAASLRQLARDLMGEVRFAGRVGDEELAAAIRASAVLALPSTREGWGLAITEAAARGTPYVAYDIPAVREQHDRLQGGLLVDPAPASLANALERMLRDPTEARRLGEQGRAAAATMTWADAGQTVEGALRDAIARFGRNRGRSS